MKQTGTLYSKANNESSVEIKEPIPNVFIYFSQNSVRKLTTKTNATGKFDFDLPLGKYQVAVSSGATSQVYQLAGGSEFELSSKSKVDDFEKWVLAPAYIDVDENPLVLLLKSLADSANDSAVKAKADADRAESEADRAEQAMNSKQDKLEFIGSGKVMKEGAGGILSISNNNKDVASMDGSVLTGIYTGRGASDPSYFTGAYGATIHIKRDVGRGQIILSHLGGLVARWYGGGTATAYHNKIYGENNTTIDSNGFLKAASPIIRLFNDRIETNDQFTEEPTFERVSTGTYRITNTLGLAKEGWYIEVPKDKNGLPYFMVDWLEDELTKEVTIFTYKRKFDFEKMDMVNGDLVDIQEDQRWIDLRFHEEDTK